MTGDRARSALAGTRFEDLSWVAETGSTNADLLAAARAGAAAGAPPGGLDGGRARVLVADHQTAGRGRLGRTWEAPPGASLLFSVLLGPPLAEAGHLLTVALGVAAVDALRAGVGGAPGIEVGLKWPNDLVAPTPAGERKLAGILAEAEVVEGRVVAVVVGMGCNVAWGPTEALPADLAGTAVSLDQLLPGHPVVDREDLLGEVLARYDRWLRRLDTAAGRRALHEAHRDRCVTLGRSVRVELPGGDLSGRAVDLAPGGELLVEPADGAPTVTVTAGDVLHLRALR